MSRDRSKNTRRPPSLSTLAPPRAKPQTPDSNRRRLAPLPELAHPNSDPFAPKSQEEAVSHQAQQRKGQRHPSTKSPVAAPPHGNNMRRMPAPKPGKAVPRSRRKVNYRLNPSFTRALSIFALIIVVGVVVFIGGRHIFAYNAMAVLLNGSHIGYIPLDRELTSTSFHDDVIAYIEERGPSGRMEIVPLEMVEVSLVRRVQNRNMQDISTIKSDIARRMNYEIVAREIYIQGIPRAIVRSQACVDRMQEDVKSQHRNGNTVSAELIIEWQTQNITVARDYYGFQSAQDALESLDHRVYYDTIYEVQFGDNKSSIADRFGIRVDDLAQVNDRLVSDVLHLGDRLIIRRNVQLLTVVYTDEFTEYIDIPAPVEEVENNTMPEHTRTPTQEGRDGRKRLTKRVIRHNDVEISSEELEAVVVVEPIAHILQVGTRPAVIERR